MIMFGEARECFASALAVLVLGVAWVEIRHLRVMVSINKDHASRMTEILDRLILQVRVARDRNE